MTKTGNLQVETRGDREVVMTRVFHAPQRLVFDAFTKPELLKKWLFGSAGWSLEICEIDLRPGGALRYVWRRTDGKEMGMSGVFQEVVAPERIVQTERFDDAWYPGEAVGTTTLTELAGTTTVTMSVLYESGDARSAVMKSGMADGMADGFDRLEGVLGSMRE